MEERITMQATLNIFTDIMQIDQKTQDGTTLHYSNTRTMDSARLIYNSTSRQRIYCDLIPQIVFYGVHSNHSEDNSGSIVPDFILTFPQMR